MQCITLSCGILFTVFIYPLHPVRINCDNVSVCFRQKAAFKHFAELRKFSLANVASIDTHDALLKHFKSIDRTMLREIASYLHLVSPVKAENGDDKYTTDFLLKLLVSTYFLFHD